MIVKIKTMDKEDFKDALANLVFEYFKHNDKDIHECYAICFVNGERYNLSFDIVKL